MCWYPGLTQEEIARLLDCSVRTVKRRWEEAKDLLAAAMTGERLEKWVSPMALGDSVTPSRLSSP